MFRNVMLWLMAALCTVLLPVSALAAETDCDSVYCFSPADFSAEGEALAGICLTSLPEEGALMLGSRVLRPGDILTAGQVQQMTFHPVHSEQDASARVEYLPIYEGAVAPCTALTVAVRGKEDKPPVAEDFALETYKNLPNTGRLKASDPEGQPLTYTVVRQGKRGDVTVAEDGTFTYTPRKNKVGVDSFVFTATDPAGNVSREATVTVTVLKPTDANQYTDTLGRDCRFAAEWMKNTGIFVGETVADNACFSPEKEVTRGEFVTMLVKALDIPPEEEVRLTGYSDEIPLWLQPYLAAAVRSGLTADLPDRQTFGADTAVTGAEAAVMLQAALDLTVPMPESNAEVLSREDLGAVPAWAAVALTAMQEHGFPLEAQAPLTRGEVARILYRASRLSRPEEGGI